MGNVRCIIEKDGDYGYIHFDKFIKIELIPRIGERIKLWYPDGSCENWYKVKYVNKVFSEDELYIKVIVEV